METEKGDSKKAVVIEKDGAGGGLAAGWREEEGLGERGSRGEARDMMDDGMDWMRWLIEMFPGP